MEQVDGTDARIRIESGETVAMAVTDDTYIRDMNPHPRVPTAEVARIALPGARVMAMAGPDPQAMVLRHNFY